MANDISYRICDVCNGKGGWYSEIDGNKTYYDCFYCEGNGFNKAEESDNESQKYLLTYNSYKKKITELLGDLIGRVDDFSTEDMGKTIKITIVPYNRSIFSEFVKFVLKLSLYSSKIDIHIIQDFYYIKDKDKYSFDWKLILSADELSDLDGFIDVVKFWDRKGSY